MALCVVTDPTAPVADTPLITTFASPSTSTKTPPSDPTAPVALATASPFTPTPPIAEVPAKPVTLTFAFAVRVGVPRPLVPA